MDQIYDVVPFKDHPRARHLACQPAATSSTFRWASFTLLGLSPDTVFSDDFEVGFPLQNGAGFSCFDLQNHLDGACRVVASNALEQAYFQC